jgi:hypothetical protein
MRVLVGGAELLEQLRGVRMRVGLGLEKAGLVASHGEVRRGEGGFRRDRVSKATPPAQSSALWHFSQYWLKKDQCPAGSAGSAREAPAAKARVREASIRQIIEGA